MIEGMVGGPGAATRALDTWAYTLGIGRRTGIGLPGEAAGTLPTPAWRQRRVNEDRPPWSIGDDESLAVGQGDIEVTPIQLAVAFAALANGGTIVRPPPGHVGQGRPGRGDPHDQPGAGAPSQHQPFRSAGHSAGPASPPCEGHAAQPAARSRRRARTAAGKG